MISSWHCVTTLRPTTTSKVTFAVRWLLTSAARSRLAPTRAVVTAADFRFVVSAPASTPVPARVRGRPSPRRRPSESSPTGHSPTVTDAQITLISGETSHGYCRPQGCTQDQGAPQGEEERRRRSGAHQEHVQQHHHRYY